MQTLTMLCTTVAAPPLQQGPERTLSTVVQRTLLRTLLTRCFVRGQVWDGDGGESVVSTKDSLGDDNLDDCGLGNLSVRA